MIPYELNQIDIVMSKANIDTSETLEEEAKAFDCQISERIINGHIPDLRLCQPCDWFRNNPWRHPEYVKLDFLEQFQLLHEAIEKHVCVHDRPLNVLEVGCGPGYMTLELARAGYNTTGIDVSGKCIEIAMGYAETDPWKNGRGQLSYMAGDFKAVGQLAEESFDAIVFLGALHHFSDQSGTLAMANRLLRKDGIILVHEPARDLVTKGNAAFVTLLKVLLSVKEGFFADIAIPENESECVREIGKTLSLLRYEREDGEKLQSVNDNEAGFEDMYPALTRMFIEEEMQDRYAFFHEVIGGLRFDDQTNFKLARFLRDMDKQLVKLKVLDATEFFFVGRKRA